MVFFKKNITMPFKFFLALMFVGSLAAQQKNVLFILVDDLGWNDLGYAGSTFHETPHIDALAANSVQFNQAYAASAVCSPSRAAIMTGQHPTRLKITDWIPGMKVKNPMLEQPKIRQELPLNQVTMAEQFKAEGFDTFFAGKWHLGSEGYFPENQGFNYNLGGHHKGSPPGGYYVPYKNPKLKDGPQGEYLTDRLTQESIRFIKEKKKAPFFLFLSFYTVHTPIQPNKQYVNKFKQKKQQLQLTQTKVKNELYGRTNLIQKNPAYASMLYALDKNIGRLIQCLKEEGLYDDTLIVFTSDNGGLSTLKNPTKRLAPTAVFPLRGGKGWLYEGGIRVPLLIKNTGKTKHKEIDTPVVGHDLYPTLLSMSKIECHNRSLDGKDLSYLFSDERGVSSQAYDRTLYWYYPHYHGSGWRPGAAVRKGDWKLLYFYETQKSELFNLVDDPGELEDKSSIYPKKVLELKKLLDAELKKHKAVLPKPLNQS